MINQPHTTEAIKPKEGGCGMKNDIELVKFPVVLFDENSNVIGVAVDFPNILLAVSEHYSDEQVALTACEWFNSAGDAAIRFTGLDGNYEVDAQTVCIYDCKTVAQPD